VTIPPHTRLKNVSLHVPLVYGSIAYYLGSASDQYATHRWRLYIRSPNTVPTGGSSSAAGGAAAVAKGLGLAIKRVTFHLHPSFANPIRVVEKPNSADGAGFFVEEDGWGEFEAMIKIEWNTGGDGGVLASGSGGGEEQAAKKQKTGGGSAGGGNSSEEKPLIIKHPIRLYHPGTTHAVNSIPPQSCLTSNFVDSSTLTSSGDSDVEIPVIHEFYDEVVFTDPTKGFYDVVMGGTNSLDLDGADGGDGDAAKASDKKDSNGNGNASSSSGGEYAFPLIDDLATVVRLGRGIKFIEQEIQEVKDRIVRANEGLEETKVWMEDFKAKEEKAGLGGIKEEEEGQEGSAKVKMEDITQ
jgi:hypothetical protein